MTVHLASGLFIETQMPFSVGRDVKMKFRLTEGRKLIQISGEIVRVASQGIGVKFKRTVNHLKSNCYNFVDW